MLLQRLLSALASGVDHKARRAARARAGELLGVRAFGESEGVHSARLYDEDLGDRARGIAIPPTRIDRSMQAGPAMSRPDPRHEPALVIPPTRIDNQNLPGLIFDTPFQEAVRALDAGDAFALFLDLPAGEQLRLIEAELAALPDADQKRVMGLLARELDRAWLPLPGPQTQAYNSAADVLLYGGAGGGGKSDLELGLAFTAHKRALIMRRRYTDLSFLIERALQINKGRDGYNGQSPPTLRTSDGRLIEFGAAQHPGDEASWQGRPHDLLCLDEATQFLESQVRFLMGWVRSTDKNQRTRVVLATNPPLSDEGQWLVRMFAPWLDPAHPNKAGPGELRWYVTNAAGEDEEVDGPGPHVVAGKPVLALSRTFVPARLSDNPYLAETDYGAKLDALPEPLRSSVRDGNFMAVRQDDAWQVIPSEWVRKAQARWTADGGRASSMTCLAADVAQGGADSTVLAPRHGTWFAPLVVRKGGQTEDGPAVAALIFAHMRDACQIVVDAGGGWGGSAIDHLKRQKIRVEGFIGAGAATGKAIGSGLEFANRRAELYWRFREALDPLSGADIALPPDADLLADLCTPRLDARAMQMRGLIQVEGKEEIRKRLGRSTDRADAVVMALAYGGIGGMGGPTHAGRPLPTTATLGYAGAKRHARPPSRASAKAFPR